MRVARGTLLTCSRNGYDRCCEMIKDNKRTPSYHSESGTKEIQYLCEKTAISKLPLRCRRKIKTFKSTARGCPCVGGKPGGNVSSSTDQALRPSGYGDKPCALAVQAMPPSGARVQAIATQGHPLLQCICSSFKNQDHHQHFVNSVLIACERVRSILWVAAHERQTHSMGN